MVDLVEKSPSINHGQIFNVLKQVSVPECQDLLSPVFALLEARTQHYSQVTHPAGALLLLLLFC